MVPNMQEEQQEAPFVLDDETRAGLAELVRTALGEDKPSRRSEVRNAWKQRAFRNGIQHVYYDNNSYTFLAPEASGMDLPRYRDVYNIYTPHWRSFVSLLTAVPGINAVPKNLQRSTDVTAAAYAEKMRHRTDRILSIKDLQAEAAGLFCTDGRVVSRVWVDNGQLCGSVYGVLEAKVPIFARKMRDWGYCILSEEIDKYQAKADWPDYAEEIGSDSDQSDSQYERIARLNIIANRKGVYGESVKSLTTRHVGWFRPSQYQRANKKLEETLKKSMPDGLRVTMCGGAVVEAIAESMDSCLRVEWPSPGQGQNRPSMLHDVVHVQEAFNDYQNNLRECAGYINAATWVDSNAVDPEALPEQRSEAGAIHVINPGTKAISDCVFQEVSNGMPPELSAASTALMQFAEFTTGDLPSLFGSGTPDQETASGQKMLSDQAKGQLSNAWSAIQRLIAGITEIAVLLEAQLNQDAGSLSVESSSGQDSFNPAAILDGEFGWYPDEDSSFPETTADKRASLQSVLSQLGQGAQGEAIVFAPDNLKLIKQFSGLTDLMIPGAEARDKQLREIEQMLKEPPVPDQTQIPQWQQASLLAQQQGQQPPPIPLTSSVQIGKYDYNQPELDKCIEWLSSPSCFEEMQKGNSQGVQNVQLHADLHAAAIAKAAPPPQFKPPNVTLTAQITDPVAIAALLGEAGAQTTPENIEASNVPEEQNQAADTQLKAAGAQHKAVLAAKEAVTPIQKPMTPEQQLEAKKTNERSERK